MFADLQWCKGPALCGCSSLSVPTDNLQLTWMPSYWSCHCIFWTGLCGEGNPAGIFMTFNNQHLRLGAGLQIHLTGFYAPEAFKGAVLRYIIGEGNFRSYLSPQNWSLDFWFSCRSRLGILIFKQWDDLRYQKQGWVGSALAAPFPLVEGHWFTFLSPLPSNFFFFGIRLRYGLNKSARCALWLLYKTERVFLIVVICANDSP